jgi:hypothetical protein
MVVFIFYNLWVLLNLCWANLLNDLKGQCHEIFDFRFFRESVSPKPLSIPLGLFRIFFENSRRYSQLKVHHRCRWYRWCIWLANISGSQRILKKIWNDPYVIFRGLGEDDSWKKTWSKKPRDPVPLKVPKCEIFDPFFLHQYILYG